MASDQRVIVQKGVVMKSGGRTRVVRDENYWSESRPRGDETRVAMDRRLNP